MRLPLASKAIAPMLWLLASEAKDGIFDGSLDELVFRLHITPKEYEDGMKPLIDKGFFIVASDTLASCLQVAIPETETERETKVETKTEKKKSAVKPEGFPVELWEDFLTLRNRQRKPLTETALKGLVREATKAGWTLEQAISHCCMKGWIGFDASWVREKLTNAEQRQSTMSQLTRGLSTPKPFWKQPTPETLEANDVQRPRLL